MLGQTRQILPRCTFAPTSIRWPYSMSMLYYRQRCNAMGTNCCADSALLRLPARIYLDVDRVDAAIECSILVNAIEAQTVRGCQSAFGEFVFLQIHGDAANSMSRTRRTRSCDEQKGGVGEFALATTLRTRPSRCE